MTDQANAPKFDASKRYSVFRVDPMMNPATGEQVKDRCNVPMWTLICSAYDAEGALAGKSVWVEAPYVGNLEVDHGFVHDAKGEEPEAFFTGVRFSRMLDLPAPHLVPVFRAEDMFMDSKPISL